MDNTENINVLSLCTGYGGLDLGLSRALQRPLRVVAVEIEAYAVANLVSKAEAGKMALEALWPDVKTFPARKFRDCFDIITAGYPCQPFSVAGKRKGKADPRHLWPFIKTIISEVRPVLCFFENVAGHLSIGFDSVVRDLDGLGYRVEAGLFTAEEVGVPHKRERLFILAHSRSDIHRGQPGGISRKTEQSTADPGKSRNVRNNTGNESKFGELADTESTERGRLSEKHARRRIKEIGRSDGMWPTRPGQEQHEWEEPRAIKSGVGRAVNGPSARVDRLRLLGNGVVPQCAEKAFRELYGIINESD